MASSLLKADAELMSSGVTNEQSSVSPEISFDPEAGIIKKAS
jgi:hypothetical protein